MALLDPPALLSQPCNSYSTFPTSSLSQGAGAAQSELCSPTVSALTRQDQLWDSEAPWASQSLASAESAHKGPR